MQGEVLRETRSVCPVCKKSIPAARVRIGGEVSLRKVCDEHGPFSALVWRGRLDFEAWTRGVGEHAAKDLACPDGCGLCPDHLQKTCCVVLEVTSRCNLGCRYCFADSGGGGPDPTRAELEARLGRLVDPGKTLVQLSGGEPTLRDDLPDLVACAKAVGCRHVQLNTNGLRLAEDVAYVRALADAGLSFVFMQFDGTSDAIHERLRGRPLLAVKREAIERCAACNIGVTLVPTVVPGVNTSDIGALLRFAVSLSPAVRGVHFQPVSYFGRTPSPATDESRFTLDELVVAIEEQTGGWVKRESLLPSRCDHPLCGLHGDFVVTPDGGLLPLSKRENLASGGCCAPAEQSREFVARRWKRPLQTVACCSADMQDMNTFVERARTHGFTVTAMAFQDAGNLDVERLRRCSLHVFDDGRFVPFCAHYLWRRAG